MIALNITSKKMLTSPRGEYDSDELPECLDKSPEK
jgi:hypothetical protein